MFLSPHYLYFPYLLSTNEKQVSCSKTACKEADPSAFGHLGSTGTAFWVDPKNDLIFIFLSNRVNPTRDNPAFSRSNIRSELFRQVYKSLQ